MNILIVHPCKGFYGGAEEVVVQLSTHLYQQGHTVLVISKNTPKEMMAGIPAGINTYRWWEFQRKVREHSSGADVICCFNFPATLATWPSKKPVVWYCNEPPELFTSWKRKPIEAFNRWWVRRSGMRVVVATPFDAERFERIYRVKPTVIPYGIDYDFWAQGKRIKYLDNKVSLLQVGTISPLKNQAWSIRVLEELLSRGVDATLTCIGGGDLKYCNEIVKRFEKRIPEDRWLWLGQRAQLEVRDAYNNYNVLLHPVLGQGGWLVPLEAWCTNIPIITVPEFQMSSLFDYVALNEQEAADMIIDIMKNGSKQMNGYWIKEEFTWEKFGERMMRLFKEISERKHS